MGLEPARYLISTVLSTPREVRKIARHFRSATLTDKPSLLSISHRNTPIQIGASALHNRKSSRLHQPFGPTLSTLALVEGSNSNQRQKSPSKSQGGSTSQGTAKVLAQGMEQVHSDSLTLAIFESWQVLYTAY
ncbi:hypothetical protein PoB_007601300 [Plakobranchus ocellatus]|uniref:Uncharacterized protein n=1 Tax=Plakobranchus ocellatus TaxID=259542 RepID=A0AAV4DZI9_9GAST|nr:hypothetical protein PoB_007601300 [Plakobranchus ocellatus]